MKHILFSILFCFYLSFIFSQEKENSSPKFYLHSLANVSLNQSSCKEYLNFWINFLYEENDSIRKKYWLPSQIKQFGNDYSLFYSSLFQYPQKSLLNYFKPYILSISSQGDTCYITTSFCHFNFTPNDTNASLNSNPFAIVEIGILKQNNNLYLFNLFEERIANWKKYNYDKIKYIIEPSLNPNELEMEKAKNFLDSMIYIFSAKIDSVNFVVCKSPESLGYLLGFNFFYAGYTTGKTFYDAKMIISGKGIFYYPHELVHLVVDNKIKTGHFLSEGIATFFGGSLNQSYSNLLKVFKSKYYPFNKNLFKTINEKPNSTDAYVSSALIVNVIYKKFGIKGLLRLKDFKDNADSCLKQIYYEFKITETEMFKLINDELGKF
jgi:hypothetical protein